MTICLRNRLSQSAPPFVKSIADKSAVNKGAQLKFPKAP